MPLCYPKLKLKGKERWSHFTLSNNHHLSYFLSVDTFDELSRHYLSCCREVFIPRSKYRTGMGHGCEAAIVGDWGISPEFFKRQLVDFCTAANWSAFRWKKFQSAQRHSQPGTQWIKLITFASEGWFCHCLIEATVFSSNRCRIWSPLGSKAAESLTSVGIRWPREKPISQSRF